MSDVEVQSSTFSTVASSDLTSFLPNSFRYNS